MESFNQICSENGLSGWSHGSVKPDLEIRGFPFNKISVEMPMEIGFLPRNSSVFNIENPSNELIQLYKKKFTPFILQEKLLARFIL